MFLSIANVLSHYVTVATPISVYSRYGRVYPEPNDDYGTFDEETNGTGMFRELVFKVSRLNSSLFPPILIAFGFSQPSSTFQRADIAVSSLDILEARKKAADFSYSFNRRSISALYKLQPEPFVNPTLKMYLSPFSAESWMLITFLGSVYFCLILTLKYFLLDKHDDRVSVIAIVGLLLNQGRAVQLAYY